MSAPTAALAIAYSPDASRAGSHARAQSPEWLVQWLALLMLFLMHPMHGLRLLRSGRLASSWWADRPDLPPGSTQAEAASVRGPFGRYIAWMCRRHGVGPEHPDWPYLSRTIVAFGGSVKGFRPGLPACGLQWWDNPNVTPGTIPGWGTRAAPTPTAALLQREALANALPPAPHAVPADPAHARVPASWLSASERQVFARAGPCPPTGPPGCPGLPTLSRLTPGAGAWPAPPS